MNSFSDYHATNLPLILIFLQHLNMKYFQDDPEWSTSSKLSHTERNLMPLRRFAMELIRHGFSSRSGASLANALPLDVNDVYSLPHVKEIMVDKNKIERSV